MIQGKKKNECLPCWRAFSTIAYTVYSFLSIYILYNICFLTFSSFLCVRARFFSLLMLYFGTFSILFYIFFSALSVWREIIKKNPINLALSVEVPVGFSSFARFHFLVFLIPLLNSAWYTCICRRYAVCRDQHCFGVWIGANFLSNVNVVDFYCTFHMAMKQMKKPNKMK